MLYRFVQILSLLNASQFFAFTWLLGLRLSSLHEEYMRSEKW